jgi:hypothetical protein
MPTPKISAKKICELYPQLQGLMERAKVRPGQRMTVKVDTTGKVNISSTYSDAVVRYMMVAIGNYSVVHYAGNSDNPQDVLANTGGSLEIMSQGGMIAVLDIMPGYRSLDIYMKEETKNKAEQVALEPHPKLLR